MSKSLFKSKTLQGILVMLLAAIAPRIGLDTGQDELAGLADAILMCLGGAWAVYGRFKASTRLTVKPGNSHLNTLLVCLLVASVALPATGCALKGKTPEEQASIIAVDISTLLHSTHARWLELDSNPELPHEARRILRRDVAPIINEALDVAVIYDNAVIAWRVSGDPGADPAALRKELRALLTDASAKMTEITLHYLTGEE